MIIIWGFRSYVQNLAMLTFLCQRCGIPAAHRLFRVTRKFTLFFLPLFPVSKKYALACAACGATGRVTKEQADEMVEHLNRANVAAAAPAIETIGATSGQAPMQGWADPAAPAADDPETARLRRLLEAGDISQWEFDALLRNRRR